MSSNVRTYIEQLIKYLQRIVCNLRDVNSTNIIVDIVLLKLDIQLWRAGPCFVTISSTSLFFLPLPAFNLL